VPRRSAGDCISKAVVSQQRLNTSGWLKGIPSKKNKISQALLIKMELKKD